MCLLWIFIPLFVVQLFLRYQTGRGALEDELKTKTNEELHDQYPHLSIKELQNCREEWKIK